MNFGNVLASWTLQDNKCQNLSILGNMSQGTTFTVKNRSAGLQTGCSAGLLTRADFVDPINLPGSVDLEVHASADREIGANSN